MTLADRLIELNRWYEGLPDGRRVFVYPAVLVAAGFVNTRLTGAPIGFVSLAALVALVVMRRSYVSGWLAAQLPVGGAVPEARFRSVTEAVTPAVAAKPEFVQRVAADVAKADAVFPVVAEPGLTQPVAPPSVPAVTSPAAPVAVQPPAPVSAEKAVPVQQVAAPKPVTRVEAATSAPPASGGPGKGGKRSAAPASRKADGKSGKRKSGDKHPH